MKSDNSITPNNDLFCHSFFNKSQFLSVWSHVIHLLTQESKANGEHLSLLHLDTNDSKLALLISPTRPIFFKFGVRLLQKKSIKISSSSTSYSERLNSSSSVHSVAIFFVFSGNGMLWQQPLIQSQYLRNCSTFFLGGGG